MALLATNVHASTEARELAPLGAPAKASPPPCCPDTLPTSVQWRIDRPYVAYTPPPSSMATLLTMVQSSTTLSGPVHRPPPQRLTLLRIVQSASVAAATITPPPDPEVPRDELASIKQSVKTAPGVPVTDRPPLLSAWFRLKLHRVYDDEAWATVAPPEKPPVLSVNWQSVTVREP